MNARTLYLLLNSVLFYNLVYFDLYIVNFWTMRKYYQSSDIFFKILKSSTGYEAASINGTLSGPAPNKQDKYLISIIIHY